MDSFDQAILDVVQADNQRSHESIGAEVGLSSSAVRRRLKILNQTGVIVANVALTDVMKLGLTFIVSVSFEKEDPSAYEDFRKQMCDQAAVSQCYSVSGDFDFILIVHAVTPGAFESWGERELMANPLIRRYSTSVVWSRTKFATKVSPTSQID